MESSAMSVNSQRADIIGSARFLWFELAGRCNFECIHCYAESSPRKDHGNVSSSRWHELLVEAQQLKVEHIQFIGGEPTLHPSFSDLICHSHRLGLGIEVYTNLAVLSEHTLKLYEANDVSIATSFYSIDPDVTARMTRRDWAHKQIVANIMWLLECGIPLRVGIIKNQQDEDVTPTINFLRSLGVKHFREDAVRAVGRGGLNVLQPRPRDRRDDLCGACANGNAAITPSGDVYPCVFSRWLPIGNINERSLAEVLHGDLMESVGRDLRAFFSL